MSALDNTAHRSSISESDQVEEYALEKTETQTYVHEVQNEAAGVDTDYHFASDFEPELQRVASILSATISRAPITQHLTEAQLPADLNAKDQRLDPNSPSFDFRLWAKALVHTTQSHGFTRPSTGFVFKDMNVTGSGRAAGVQQTMGSILTAPLALRNILNKSHSKPKHILKDFNGAVRPGELLMVLGRPGSGCTTFLKSVCGYSDGTTISPGSTVHYSGVPQHDFVKEFRGDVVYNQEQEEHFPQLTVQQTLRFAAEARLGGTMGFSLPRSELSQYVADIAMNLFGLSHVRHTRVGDDFVRGVSGGERKRVGVAEMAVARASIGAWDNSTKGLDAAAALNFVRSLKVSAEIFKTTHAVAIYQASQSIYDLFDKATVLYEGRQIYFGPAENACAYFEKMGWQRPSRQTSPDFLTAVTNPNERQSRRGFESMVPRTAEEFEDYWHRSTEYQACISELDLVTKEHTGDSQAMEKFREFHHQAQGKHTRPGSAYRSSIPMQIRLCMTRARQRMWSDRTPILTRVGTQIIQALIIGSIFYNTPATTGGFFAKGSLLFFTVLMNALMSVSEITDLYKQRPIVRKHFSYALYHPFTESLAGIIMDLPVKFLGSTAFNVVLYFLGGLRYDAGPFFVFFLFSFVAMLTMSAIFRTIAASTKAVPQAMMFAGIIILAIVMYTGFTLRVSNMHPWFRWINYVNPVAYAFEALLVNELHDVSYPCDETSLVPPYGTGTNFRCAVSGSLPGKMAVSGDAFAKASYGYLYSHLWRNFGILIAFMIVFYIVSLVATEFNSHSVSSGEFLSFRKGHAPRHIAESEDDLEAKKLDSTERNQLSHRDDSRPSNDDTAQLAQKDIFTWRNVTLDIPVKGGQRRLLDGVSGWVKPGTMTALMGVSGAGKTTLLDTLAQRIKIGVITGDMLVNGRPLDLSFQRKTGYVQQQDLHLDTATVREALQFSAMLRQPQSVSTEEKYAWVEHVIATLDMEEFSEAIIGMPGEGLNVEQRKRLTIGVELAAKPALLLFLDEPTSGLDSPSSWSIITILRKLADNGQAILATIHQPSAMLFQEFDRLLFLAKGGKTVYFGDIGLDSRVVLDYFHNSGARACEPTENPAEYILKIVTSEGNEDAPFDWPAIWKANQESKDVQIELDRIHASKIHNTSTDRSLSTEFSLPLRLQVYHVTKRVFQQYWRMPQYIMGKWMLATMASLFTGFTFFRPNSSQSGMQDAIFAIFMVTTVFTPLVLQITPRFFSQRDLYEIRERPSRCYSWIAFMTSVIVVEIPYQLFAALLVYVSWYFAVFGANQPSLTQGLMLVFCMQFYLFASTFATMVAAALPDPQTAANIMTLLFSLMLTFDGTLQIPSALPDFWTFMWRVSPLTYLMGAWAGTGLGDRAITCAQDELAVFDPPTGQTCAQYLAPYFKLGALGQVYNPSAMSGCQYCQFTNANQFLARSEIYRSDTNRNIGIVFGYIVFNIFAAVVLYYVFRVKRISPRSGIKRMIGRK